MKTAIVCAWRKGENDLDATLRSAMESAPKGTAVYAMEDKTADGPARTRHKGIASAKGADVILIVDAHMRFAGDALATMARRAGQGALVCAQTFHNEECAFKGTPYAGARIVWRAKDGRTHTALAGKWSKDAKPGPRGCIMGGAYAFRRDWYYAAGQPLAMLPGWGGDEEALSIAAWLHGVPVECIGVSVAHRYRPRPPWSCMDREFTAARASRMALISAFVYGHQAWRQELEDWQRRGVPEGVASMEGAEIQRVREHNPGQRSFAEWRQTVCEGDEIDGQQEAKEAEVAKKKTTVNKLVQAEQAAEGAKCTHCGAVHIPKALTVLQAYPNGMRRSLCPNCGRMFIWR